MNDAWIDEFLRLLTNTDATMDNVKKAFQLKNEKLPKILYRYRPPKEHSIQELEHDSVFVSQPSSQNDPLDSICTLSPLEVIRAIGQARFAQLAEAPGIVDRLTEEQKQFCAQSGDPVATLQEVLIATAAPNEKAEFIKLRDALNRITKTEGEKIAAPMRQIPHHHLRICCFTPDYQSASMWDRYASGHKGLCIAYDFSLLPPDELRRRWLYPVIYRDTPFDLTPLIVSQLEGARPFPLWPMLASIHKSADWSNEREWRLVMPPEVDPKPKLELLLKPSAVYLGARMEPDARQRTAEIARHRGISIFKMEVSQQERRMIAIPS